MRDKGMQWRFIPIVASGYGGNIGINDTLGNLAQKMDILVGRVSGHLGESMQGSISTRVGPKEFLGRREASRFNATNNLALFQGLILLRPPTPFKLDN
jgi:hypothetical protein